MKLLNTYSLNKIEILHYDNRIVEVIASEGAELEKEDIINLVNTIHSIEPPVIGYLANRKYQYSFNIY